MSCKYDYGRSSVVGGKYGRSSKFESHLWSDVDSARMGFSDEDSEHSDMVRFFVWRPQRCGGPLSIFSLVECARSFS